MYYCLDWKKIVEIICEKDLKYVQAGLNGDWENTCMVIYREGEPVLDSDPQFYSCSNWAIPAIIYIDKGSLEPVRENCFFTVDSLKELNEEGYPFDPNESWPINALTYLVQKKKEKKFQKSIDEKNSKNFAENHERPRTNTSSYTDSVSFTNSLKSIKNHSDAIIDEVERIRRAIDGELTIEVVGEISQQIDKMTHYIEEFYRKFFEKSEDSYSGPQERLRAIYEKIVETFIDALKKVSATDKLKLIGDAVIFLETFREIALKETVGAFEIHIEKLNEFKGNDDYN